MNSARIMTVILIYSHCCLLFKNSSSVIYVLGTAIQPDISGIYIGIF